MTVRGGDEYNPFATDAAEISGNVAPTGAAVVAMRFGARVFFHGYPKLSGKKAVFVSAFERLGFTKVLCVYGRHD